MLLSILPSALQLVLKLQLSAVHQAYPSGNEQGQVEAAWLVARMLLFLASASSAHTYRCEWWLWDTWEVPAVDNHDDILASNTSVSQGAFLQHTISVYLVSKRNTQLRQYYALQTDTCNMNVNMIMRHADQSIGCTMQA